MTALVAGRVLTATGLTGPARVELDGERIAAVVALDGADAVEAEATGRTLAPGFIDLQVNGIDDTDVATADGEAWTRLDELVAAQGVTTWCPTLITAPLSTLDAAIGRIRLAMSRPPAGRPTIAGIHVEGPFLGGAPGAHPRQWLRPIDDRWLEALPEEVRIVTLAPELDGASGAVAALAARGTVVSLGHSAASFDLAQAAAAAGASMVTHVFNGMPPLHHRTPGLLGAALTDDRLRVGLIADGVHVHPALLPLVFAAKGAAGVALVTDAVAWRAERVGNVEVRMVAGTPRLADGTLAGSALAMDRAVANVVHAGIPLDAALTAASATPAAILGLADRGRIAPGLRADLVLLDAALEVRQTWVAGEQIAGD